MSRIGPTLEALRSQGRTALVPFITAGDPRLEATVPALNALVQGGADLLELGVPFSDPEADGPAIQAASERALANGTGLRDALDCVAEFRSGNDRTPVILMGYLNSVLAMGEGAFATAAAAAGVDGAIIVNLPPEESEPLRGALAQQGIDLILLAAPTTSDERLSAIDRAASGFVYLVSLKGTTGADHISVSEVNQNLTRLRARTQLPVLVGFGIKDGPTARALGERADGVVVGAAIVSRMAALSADAGAIPAALRQFVSEVRQALDA
ncbi:MAG: tryptophan synthase subunit alpha [Gammaproteobacteria bacterium]|nr:tryptophan synthase subunit alpha [Gammaproteobacteria bacterium]